MKKLLIGLTVILIFTLGMYLTAADTFEDGTYTGFSQANDKGYVEAEVVINDGKISDVNLTEFQDTGVTKGEDYRLDEFHEAMEVLPERFVEANDYDVDAYSGATGTSNKAIEAVKMALDKAKGITEFDGTFHGASDISERGGRGVAWVTVEEGTITDVDLKEISDIEDGEYKGEDYSLDEFHEAKEELPERMIESNSYDVDTYSGATGSSERWIEAVKDALSKIGL